MNWNIILKLQGFLLIIIAISMLFPVAFSIYYKSNDIIAFLISILITLAIGLFLAIFFKSKNKNIRISESFIVVSLGWILASICGALPFFIHGTFGSFIDCLFESVSGFTTTGASILTDIEIQPKGLLFWRSMTHWLGGMGIILLTIAILPFLGLSSGQLYNAEVPGPIKDRISSKIKDTAKILWLIYLGMTVIETILLMFGGMSLYDALCHTFGTLATGGFSTLNKSIAGYNSLYIEIIIILFMYMAGINFSLYFYLLKGNFKDFINNREWRFYTIVLVVATILITLNLFFYPYSNEVLEKFSELKDYKSNIFKALRASLFQVVSITTTTGFVTKNFDIWPDFSRFLLIILMFFGGCSGSTGGGIKQIRIMIVFRSIINEIKKLKNPNVVVSLKIGKDIIPKFVSINVIVFFALFIFFFAFVSIFLTLMGYDIITSFSASIATLANIGPGLARVGAIQNYAFFDPISKIVLCISMLMGRLELYSIIILLYSLIKRKI